MQNEKALFKATIACDDDSHVGIRLWYFKFTRACHDYGFYCHPFYAFRTDHGGQRGFTAGDLPTDDLHISMVGPLERQAGPLHRLLMKPNMFPPNSRLRAIVQASDDDGFIALKAIIFESHPAFYPQPSTLIIAYPMQRELSILAFYKTFNDYLQLRAYIMDVDSDLDSEAELDIFINNCKHGVYLNRLTRDARRIASEKYKFQGEQLVETLTKCLLNPDSPAIIEQHRPRLPTSSAPPF